MFHLLAFYSSVAASQTNAKLNAVEDGQYTIANSNFLLNEKHKVRRAYLVGAGAVEGRINIPSLRVVALPRIHPVDENTAPQNDPPVIEYGDYGVDLLPAEGVSVEATTNADAGPLATSALLFVYPKFTPAPVAPSFTVKMTASIVTSVGVWGRGSMTQEQELPSGKYAVVGMDARGTNALAMRLRFPGGTMLPGVVAQQAGGEFMQFSQRFGRLGLFGIFDSVQLPTLEVLGLGTTDTQTVYLDIIKVS